MKLLTSGQIAARLDVHRDMVAYALRRLDISPIGRAGQVRVFPPSAIGDVKTFLRCRQLGSKGRSRNDE